MYFAGTCCLCFALNKNVRLWAVWLHEPVRRTATKGQIVQYGNYKDAAKIVRSSRINVENMSAAVVYLAEVRGTVHEEGNR